MRDAELDRYAARNALKDAMISVLVTEGRVQGLLLVSGRLGDVGTFAGSDLALLETFARHVATSLDRGRLETDLRRVIELQEELRHAAMHDPLTELPNRTLFLDRTQHDLHLAGRNGQWPAVLYIDLDGFKPVNDTYGHQAGDVLLKVFAAAAARAACATADTAARLGGDEFAVLLHGPIDDAGVQTALDRIRAELDLRVDLGGGRTAKVGRQHRRGLLRSRHRHRRADPAGRPGHVHRQARRQGHLGVLRPALEADEPSAGHARPADVQTPHSFLRHPGRVTAQTGLDEATRAHRPVQRRGRRPAPARRGQRLGHRDLADLRADPAHQRLLALQHDPVRHRRRAAGDGPLQRRVHQRRASACSTPRSAPCRRSARRRKLDRLQLLARGTVVVVRDGRDTDVVAGGGGARRRGPGAAG